MVRVVLDTNVLVAGLRSQLGASYEIIQRAALGQFEFVISIPLVLQYEAVLKRMSRDLRLTSADIDDFLDYFCAIAISQEIYYLWRPVLSDPNDDMVLELAANSSSSILVTHNVKDFGGSDRFRIDVMTPKSFLQFIRRQHGGH